MDDYTLEDEMRAVLERAFALWRERHEKYGPMNIALWGATGCAIRACDKVMRLRRHYLEGVGDLPDETVADAWLDLLNYAAMGLLCHEGKWPYLTERQG